MTPAEWPVGTLQSTLVHTLRAITTKASWKHEMTGPWEAMGCAAQV